MARKHGGIPVSGGILTTEPRKYKKSLKNKILRVLVLTLALMGANGSEAVDIVLWNRDRTLVLYREGPFRGLGVEYSIRQFEEEINQKGMEVFVAQRRNHLDDSKWV
jgi:hypothetical protein